jgi:NAD(P)-dependent dehydrogenase (short-subunit alcohol dehydrogenase family)
VDALLRDRTVVVLGATGAVGSALLELLGARGARVAAVVRRPWQVAGVTQKLTRASIAPTRQLVGVVGSEDSHAAAGFVKGAEDSLGPIAAFISTAGAFAFATVGEEDNATAGEMWQANFACVHNLARAVVAPMRRRRAGAMVFTGARAVAALPQPGLALYRASKAALHAYAACLAHELAPAGIGVAVLAPGTIDTEANRRAMPDVDRSTWLPPARVAHRLVELAAAPPRPPGEVVVDCS